MTLKAVSLSRPWTELVLFGGKNIENRRWVTHYRGPLVIHAAQSYDPIAAGLAVEVLGPAARIRDKHASPLGYLGLVDLVGVCTDGIRLGTCKCGPWAMEGQNHWQLRNPRPFPADRVINAGGRLQLWDAPENVVDLAVELGFYSPPVEVEQLDLLSLDDLLEPIVQPRPLPLMPAGVNSSFDAFHHHNPWVFRALERLAADWISKGNKRVGVKGLFEVLRWHYGRAGVAKGQPLILNNNHTSRYARLLLEAHPEWTEHIETRELRSA